MFYSLTGFASDICIKSEKLFADEYKAAHDKKDHERIMSLMYWEGAYSGSKESYLNRLKFKLSQTASRVVVKDLSPDRETTFIKNDHKYEPNLVPIAELEIHYSDTSKFKSSNYLLGRKDECYFIVRTRKVPL